MGRIFGIAAIVGVMLLSPAAQGGDFGDLVNAITTGKLTKTPNDQARPFDQGTNSQIDIVGAHILVKGIVNGEERLVLLQITGPFNATNPRKAMWSVVEFAAPVWEWQGEEKGPVLVGWPWNYALKTHPLNAPMAVPLATAANPPVQCSPQPVLAHYTESGYGIDWCKKTSTSRIRKKNYSYLFANGDYSLVMTLEHNCDVPADKSAMPPVVQQSC